MAVNNGYKTEIIHRILQKHLCKRATIYGNEQFPSILYFKVQFKIEQLNQFNLNDDVLVDRMAYFFQKKRTK